MHGYIYVARLQDFVEVVTGLVDLRMDDNGARGHYHYYYGIRDTSELDGEL